MLYISLICAPAFNINVFLTFFQSPSAVTAGRLTVSACLIAASLQQMCCITFRYAIPSCLLGMPGQVVCFSVTWKLDTQCLYYYRSSGYWLG